MTAYKKEPSVIPQNLSHTPELCVLCGCKTEFMKDTPIQNRRYYIIGCGQLCQDCYEENEAETSTTSNSLTSQESQRIADVVMNRSKE